MLRTQRRIAVLVLTVAMLLLGAAQMVLAQTTCAVTDQSTETVLPGVTLTYDSSFHCRDAEDSGTYEVAVTVANAADSAEAVRIDDVVLSHTTPRPRGQGPDASADASGVPVTLEPGAAADIVVSGDYELVDTDEGAKANLHLRALGEGVSSGEPFALGVNVHLRAPGVAD